MTALEPPGVHIREITPEAPIEGVGTSTAVFLGTAERGTPGQPIFLTSFDAFRREFHPPGGPTAMDRPTIWLTRAVQGFFLNGGRLCYVLRVGIGKPSFVELASRQTGSSPDPVLIAHARDEGKDGDGITIRVENASLLRRRLGEAGSTAQALTLRGPSTPIERVATSPAADARRVLTVASSAGFGAGDPVQVVKTGLPNLDAVVDRVDGPGTVRLQAALTGTDDYGGGELRRARLRPADRELLLVVPTGLRLVEALPPGAVVLIQGPGGSPTIRKVASPGADRVTLTEAVGTAFELTGATASELRSLEFDLTVTDPRRPAPERFRWLSTSPEHPLYWLTSVTSESVRLVEPDAPPAGVEDPRPVFQTFTLGQGENDNREAAWSQFVIDPKPSLEPLKPLDDVSLVCIPGLTDPDAQQAVIDHCEELKNRFAVLDPPPRLDVAGIRSHAARLRSEGGYAALYYPGILVRDLVTGRNQRQPPSGHIVGVYARTDALRGVHKAPANTTVRGAVALEERLTDADQIPLNNEGINALRSFGGGPPLIWGARTISDNVTWRYVNVRRLMVFIEESIRRGVGWAVFEPNDRALWQKLRRSIAAFLNRVWRDGALFGATPDEAYSVRIDDALNPPEDRRQGRLTAEVGVQPTSPAEKIFILIGLLVGDEQQ